MTEDQAIEALNQLRIMRPDYAHQQADALLLTFLEAGGHVRLVTAYKELAKSKGHLG
jgi:hypothetical protein